MDKILEAAAKLLDVKSLTTIALTVGFVVLAARGELTAEFQSVYLVVISFYFGTQYQKSTDNLEFRYRIEALEEKSND